MQSIQRMLEITEIYPQDRLCNPEIQEMILNEIKSDLFSYAFPSANINYLNLENRLLEIFNLNQNDLRRYLEKCFLLKFDVLSFIFELPQKLRKIERHNDTYLSLNTDKISGRVNWPSTLRACFNSPRYISRYYIHSNRKTYETSANKVLQECVNRLLSISFNIIRYFRLKSRESLGWQSIILEMYDVLKRSQRDIINRIPPTPPTSHDYIKTLKHKKNFYRVAAQVGLALKSIETSNFLLESWTDFYHTISENLDKLYEIYVLLRIIKGISIRLDLQPTLLLQGPRENLFFASFHQYPVSIFIYYQKAPFISSLYRNTLEKYGLNLKKRIPDICIQIITQDNVKNNILIEVKRTEDLQYLRASIYKVLGYLSDYSVEDNLHPFLVIWDLPQKNEKNLTDGTFLSIFCYTNLSELIGSIVKVIGDIKS
ncbi:MAG: hypothetical protein ACFE9L_08840 [Candidatus Hodarchaeota archaeon]